jgi:hypothetical protein
MYYSKFSFVKQILDKINTEILVVFYTIIFVLHSSGSTINIKSINNIYAYICFNIL